MSTPNGYNNPAYCHQFDSSLYDYQYIPEIDPDSPDLNQESNRRQNQSKMIHPNFEKFTNKEYSESDEFEGSDESNGSIIIEECNNRRVTLICEKRSKTETNKDEYYEDGNYRGAYYQDISLESENGYDVKRSEEKSLRHQRPLAPPIEQKRIDYPGGNDMRLNTTPNFQKSTTSISNYQQPQRYHRYEEIQTDEDYPRNSKKTVHRYAEIVPNEDGYPILKKEIQVEKSRDCYFSPQKENVTPKTISKPRAISPISYPKAFTPPVTPSRTNQRNNYSKDLSPAQFSPNSISSILYSSSPVQSNSFEMAELSPPRSIDGSRYLGNDQTFFIHSPKRQPPIGASSPNDLQEPYSLNGRCILPKNLQKITNKKERSHSLPGSPKRREDLTRVTASPGKPTSDGKIPQIFHVKPNQTKPKTNSRGKVFSEKENNSARRNISNSFTDPVKEGTPKRKDCRSPQIISRSPYKPTTTEIIPPKTAIITPIFQRKNQQEEQVYTKRNFEKMSQAFQSTGNIYSKTREVYQTEDYQTQGRLMSPARIKRNQSVPNFHQTFASDGKNSREYFQQDNQIYSRNLDFQYSPKKPTEHLTSIDKSSISLMDQTSSWSNYESDYHPHPGYCLILAAIVQLITAVATIAISFYLLSKVGRKYYLDFGILAGFVNFIIGLLGFRSHCWRWLPNRNYVSGFIILSAFSALTCAGFSYLIIARPMMGDPILDVMGGAICGVSVLTVLLALTGLTMSGCCKTPPPDNRVTNI